jgi:hypothetical protein
MKVEIFTICEAATAKGGTLNILGAFDTIHAKHLPITIPQCSVVLRIRWGRIESGPHSIALHFVDEDGRKIIPPLNQSINVKVSPPDDSAISQLILNAQRLQFKRPGKFVIDLAVDKVEAGSVPFYVKKV